MPYETSSERMGLYSHRNRHRTNERLATRSFSKQRAELPRKLSRGFDLEYFIQQAIVLAGVTDPSVEEFILNRRSALASTLSHYSTRQERNALRDSFAQELKAAVIPTVKDVNSFLEALFVGTDTDSGFQKYFLSVHGNQIDCEIQKCQTYEQREQLLSFYRGKVSQLLTELNDMVRNSIAHYNGSALPKAS